MLSETLSTGDPSSRVGIARLTLQLRALLQEAADAEAMVAGSNEETARAELRARLEPLMAERRRGLEEALRVAHEEAAAQVLAAHRQAAAMLAPKPVTLVAESVSDQQLQADIDAAHVRAAATRERTLIKEAQVRAALNEELTVARDALAAIERENELAIAAVRHAAQIEVEQILAGLQGNAHDAR